jgi:(+)-trans-carveol dehydrogenase
MGRLNGRVAFVTGAARGQGRAHCVRLAAEGADIIAIDIAGPVAGSPVEPSTMDQLEETRDLVEKTGRRVLVAGVDVRDYDGLKSVVDEGVRRFGRLDVVVANAGTMAGGRMSGGYGAAKHGLVGLCQTLAVEVARYNIRVNTIHPNGVNTAMTKAPDPAANLDALKADRPDDHEKWLFRHVTATALPEGMQEPADVAATVAFLASDESRFMTGTMLQIGAGNQLL